MSLMFREAEEEPAEEDGEEEAKKIYKEILEVYFIYLYHSTNLFWSCMFLWMILLVFPVFIADYNTMLQ